MSALRPPASVLRDLYVAQGLSTRQIGSRFGVSKTQVLRWMKHYGIDRRPLSFSDRVKAGLCPDRETLYHLIQVEHRPYAEIASMYEVDERSVHFWLDRYSIPRSDIWVTRRRGDVPEMPDVSVLRRMYVDDGMSSVEIGRQFDVSGDTIRRVLESHGIDLRPSGFDGGKRFTCDDGHEVRSTYELRVDNWLHHHGVHHVVEPAIPGLPGCRADFLANGWYIEIWGVTGSERYTAQRKRKTVHYADRHLPLIGLTPWMFSSRGDHAWRRHLLKVVDHPKTQTFQARLL